MNFDIASGLREVALFFPGFLFALCFHEFAHGWMAKRKGDRTAEMMGRLTLNPVAHADPIGTVILPIMAAITHLPLFGWAKPVPVNERNFKNPRADMFWVAIAGPASNILLACLAALGLFIYLRFGGVTEITETGVTILKMVVIFVQVNVLLAVFNMIPLHPLDGAKVLARFLPESVNRTIEDAQNVTGLILMGLFVTGAFGVLAIPVSYISSALLRMAGV